MKSLVLSKIGLLMIGMATLFVSCTDTGTTEAEVETFVEETIYRIQESANMGRFGCYELVFPVTLTFPDGSLSRELNSYDDLKSVLKNWRADNKNPRIRPVITLPFSVITAEGELIVVDTVEELKRLRIECKRTFFDNNGPVGHDGRGKFCFRLQYPLSILFPDGTTTAYETRKDMHLGLKDWKQNNQGSDVRPVLVFPLTVVMEDGTIVNVDSKEDLKALKEDCR
ncbi:MAG: hypothetical protein WAT79_07285 [Saprospiraceae bacterium]